MSRKLLVAIIVLIAISAISLIVFAGSTIEIRYVMDCRTDASGYDTHWTVKNKTTAEITITYSRFTFPSGGYTEGVLSGTIPANGTIPFNMVVPNEPQGNAELTVSVSTGETDSNRNWISGHCPGPDATPTQVVEPTNSPTSEPSITPSITAEPSVTQTIDPWVTVTATPEPSQTQVSSGTPVSENLGEPVYPETFVPTATPEACNDEGCREAYCEWLNEASAIWIRSDGDVGPLFSKVEFTGWDAMHGEYFIEFQMHIDAVIALGIEGLVATNMQCSMCEEAPIVIDIGGLWAGMYVANISNVSNLALAFEAKGLDKLTALAYAINVMQQFNNPAVGNYTSGYYIVGGNN